MAACCFAPSALGKHCRWDVYEGRLAPRQQVARAMSTGLDSALPMPEAAEEAQQLVAPAAAGAGHGAGPDVIRDRCEFGSV